MPLSVGSLLQLPHRVVNLGHSGTSCASRTGPQLRGYAQLDTETASMQTGTVG